MIVVSILFGFEILIFVVSSIIGLMGFIGFCFREERNVSSSEDDRTFGTMLIALIISLLSFTAICGTIFYTVTEIAEQNASHQNCF